MSSKRFETEVNVAKILATQYYSGWSNVIKCNMTKDEYFQLSIYNWIDAARGVISLIDQERKEEENGSE